VQVEEGWDSEPTSKFVEVIAGLAAGDRRHQNRKTRPSWLHLRIGRGEMLTTSVMYRPTAAPKAFPDRNHPMTNTATTSLNDVNLEAVGALASAIVDDAAKGATNWSASVATVREFAPIQSDEPRGLGGSDAAPNPVEQLLAALGNCLAVGYAANASARGIELRNLRIDLDGDLDLHSFLGLSDGNAGFETIRASVHIDSDASPEVLAELHAKVTASSPVGHTLERQVPVTIDLA
jgi:uncharacterized OsmC-like protein